MHPQTNEGGNSLPHLPPTPPWVVLHLPHAGATLPDDFGEAPELALAAAAGQDRAAVALFLDPAGFSPNVRGHFSRAVVDLARFDLASAIGGADRLSASAVAALQAHHAAHHERVAWAVRTALDLFGQCLLVEATTFAEDSVAGTQDADVRIGGDTAHTPPSDVDAFVAAFAEVGFAVARDALQAEALVPLAAVGTQPAVRAIRIAVRRRLVGETDEVLAAQSPTAARVRRALTLAAYRVMPKPIGRRNGPAWQTNDAINPFLVRLADGRVTPHVTHTLPSLPPTLSLQQLLAGPTALHTALGLHIDPVRDADGRRVLQLTHGIDHANRAARERGVRVRFLPEIDPRGAGSTAIAEATLQAYRETEYRTEGAIRVTLKVDTNHLALRQFYALYDAESVTFVTAYNPQGCSNEPADNRRRHDRLRAHLQRRRVTYFEGAGAHPSNGWPPEPSFLVFGLDFDESCALGRQCEQDAIVWAGIDCKVRLVLLR